MTRTLHVYVHDDRSKTVDIARLRSMMKRAGQGLHRTGDAMMKLGDLFTGAELAAATKLYRSAQPGTFAKLAAAQIVQPALARINKATGQENDARYLAYMLEFALNQTEGAKRGTGDQGWGAFLSAMVKPPVSGGTSPPPPPPPPPPPTGTTDDDVRTYHGHQIILSDTAAAESGKALYEIRGRFSKPAGKRPFLASVAAAQQWIDDEIEYADEG